MTNNDEYLESLTTLDPPPCLTKTAVQMLVDSADFDSESEVFSPLYDLLI